MPDLSKSFTLEEVEALLAAERERCAKVAEDPNTVPNTATGKARNRAIAAAIRGLPQKPIGSE